MVRIKATGDWIDGTTDRDGFDGWAEGDTAEVSVLFDWERDWDDPEYDEDEQGPKPPEKSPQRWCNGAGVDVLDDAVRCWISTGDPRGAFCMEIRQLSNGELVINHPYPGQGFAHEETVEVGPGALVIARTQKEPA